MGNGLANGTPFEMIDIVFKSNCTIFPYKIENSHFYCAAALASDVNYIICRHKVPFFKTKKIDSSLRPGFFKLSPKKITVANKWKTIKFSSTITSFLAYPMSSLSGHKTQGNTLDKLIVGSWDQYKYSAKGCFYVALSRLSDLDNIFLL